MTRTAFWITAGALALAKLALVSDLSLQIIYAPSDDALYAQRAWYLLRGEGFGPYDSRTLLKLPGLSLWLAGTRVAGIPHLFALNLLYLAAGFYFAAGLLRCGFGAAVTLATLAAFLFNPVTLGYEWIRVIREPLAVTLLALLAGAMLHLLCAVRERTRGLKHALVLAATFAFALLLREEDVLLWPLLAAFLVAAAWAARAWGGWREPAVRLTLAAALVLPAGLALAANAAARAFVAERYGAPLLHDFGEGEFPRLVAAIRSVDAAKDNRLVMVPQETLGRLQAEVPALRPVIERLPRPHEGSFSCVKDGVCSEIGNGWMLMWLKDAAYDAGLTPTLAEGQAYFRRVRGEIEAACAAGRLKCTDRGAGMVPPFALKWTRGIWEQWRRNLKLSLHPHPYVVGEPPALYKITPEQGRLFQVVTMTDYLDTQAQAAPFGATARRAYRNAYASWREPLASAYLHHSGTLVALAGAALAAWAFSRRVVLGPFGALALVLAAFALLRLSAMAYLATFFGGLDHRHLYSNYVLQALLALPVLAAMAAALWRGLAAVPRLSRLEVR